MINNTLYHHRHHEMREFKGKFIVKGAGFKSIPSPILSPPKENVVSPSTRGDPRSDQSKYGARFCCHL